MTDRFASIGVLIEINEKSYVMFFGQMEHVCRSNAQWNHYL